jgi:hypothetical protein
MPTARASASLQRPRRGSDRRIVFRQLIDNRREILRGSYPELYEIPENRTALVEILGLEDLCFFALSLSLDAMS